MDHYLKCIHLFYYFNLNYSFYQVFDFYLSKLELLFYLLSKLELEFLFYLRLEYHKFCRKSDLLR